MVSEGQMVKEGEAVAELIIDDPVRLWVNIPERFSDQVKLGQTVRVTIPSHPETAFEGKVSRINPSVETANRTFQVEAILPNTQKLLRPGGFAKASIIVQRNAKATVVPIESIGQFAGVTKLFLVRDGKAHAITDVSTGVEGRGWIEVISKQMPQEGQVVTTGQTQLAEGTPVAIRTPVPSAEPKREATAAAAENPTRSR
jgi:RND family efflux transporter MFP subunit